MTQVVGPLAAESSAAGMLSRQLAVVLSATVATLAVSRMPEIVLREGLGFSAPWLPVATVAIATLFWLGSRAISPLRVLSGYLGVMTAVVAVVAALQFVFESAAWASIAPPSAGPMVVLMSERLLLGAVAVGFIALLVVAGGRDAARYLRIRGAPSVAAGRTPARVRWSVAGPIAIVILVGLTALAMAQATPAQVNLGAAAPFLVMGVLAAAINAFWEEAIFRAAPLARLAPVIGPGLAVVLLAVWFGLGHFYGGAPSGPFGAVMVGLVGLVLGRAMADTRGFAWPWAIHFSIDVTIYTTMALAASEGG